VNPPEQNRYDRAGSSTIDEYTHRSLETGAFPAHDEQFGRRSHEEQGDREVNGRRVQLLQNGNDAGFALVRMTARFVVPARSLATGSSLAHYRHRGRIVRLAIRSRSTRRFTVLFIAMGLNRPSEEQACGEERQK
jgi:hypothetical protein